MAKITVYEFTVYDITTDECRKSRRMGTHGAVQWAKGQIIESTAREVEECDVGREVPGMTDRDFAMRSGQIGFQRAVPR